VKDAINCPHCAQKVYLVIRNNMVVYISTSAPSKKEARE
jgi:hypothetical protein